MALSKAEIRALAEKIANSPEQKKIAKEWGDAMYNSSSDTEDKDKE